MAFFRESVRNVRLLLTLSSAWLCVVSLFALVVGAEPYSPEAFLLVGTLVLGCFYLFVAVRLEHFLVARPALVKGTLLVMITMNALTALFDLAGKSFGSAIQSIVGALLGWYVLVNVRRLAREARPEMPASG